jgi:hypothetical protein
MLGCIPAGLGESKADKKAEYKFVIVPKVADPGSTACRPGRLLSIETLLRKPEPIRLRRRRRARVRGSRGYLTALNLSFTMSSTSF